MRPMSVLAHLLFGFAILISGCAKLNFFKRAESSHRLANGPRVGAPAPEIDGEDFAGKPIKLRDYRGKVVVVVFWATWCPPCMAMVPHERELAARYRDKPFVLLGINNDKNPAAALKTIAAEKMTWPICKTCDPGNTINERWGVNGIPAIHVIDPNGILRYTGVRGPHLDTAVATLLAEAEAKH